MKNRRGSTVLWFLNLLKEETQLLCLFSFICGWSVGNTIAASQLVTFPNSTQSIITSLQYASIPFNQDKLFYRAFV